MAVLRNVFLLSGAVAQIAFGALPFVMEWEETVASRSNAIDSLITPAGYAFSIWSLLFAGLLVFALYHLFRPSHPPLQRLGWLAGAAVWGNAVWEIYVPLYGFGLPSVLIIFGSLLALVVLGDRAQRDGAAGRLDVVFRAPLFALAGWLTAAAFVNLQVMAMETGLPWLGEGGVPQALVVLALASGAAVALTLRWASLSYAAAFGWGLAAIWIGNRSGGDTVVGYAALAALGLLALAWLFAVFRRVRRRRAG